MSDNNDFRKNLKYSNPEQQDVNEKMMFLLDEYQKSNSFENREFLCYLSAAIFLTYKKLYPQLSLYILFRTKSDASYIKNINKEFTKFIKEGDSISFDSSSITKDISGLKIILDNINFSLPFKGNSDELFNDPEISKLFHESNQNLEFINKVNDFLQATIKSPKTYYELKCNLLKRIIEITPKEFTRERTPEASFQELYDSTMNLYNYYAENDDFPTTISPSEISTLSDLLNDFRSRVYDPLQFATLQKTLPVVFDDPLIKNVLQTSYSFEKHSLKPNAFQADYYNLSTPFGKIEVISQSNKAHYVSTKGSAFHSGIPGKSINVKDFFELANPEKDQHDISYYFDILDSISADSMVSPYEIPDFKTNAERDAFFNSSKGAAYLESERLRLMMAHIRIKDKMIIYPQYVPKEIYVSRQTGEIDTDKLQELISNGTLTNNSIVEPAIIDTDEYLLSTALSLSPYINVCSSGHSSFTNAEIHHKKIIGEFAEVLRKKDSNTCLRDLLIRRLEDIIENINDSNSKFSNNPKLLFSIEMIKRHDEMSAQLPKDISTKNIIRYAEKLRTIEQTNIDSREH